MSKLGWIKEKCVLGLGKILLFQVSLSSCFGMYYKKLTSSGILKNGGIALLY